MQNGKLWLWVSQNRMFSERILLNVAHKNIFFCWEIFYNMLVISTFCSLGEVRKIWFLPCLAHHRDKVAHPLYPHRVILNLWAALALPHSSSSGQPPRKVNVWLALPKCMIIPVWTTSECKCRALTLFHYFFTRWNRCMIPFSRV